MTRTGNHRKRHYRRRRHGAAATEFAVCLPVLMLLLLGMLEACTMIFLKQSLAVAAYEGGHTALAADARLLSEAEKSEDLVAYFRIAHGCILQPLEK